MKATLSVIFILLAFPLCSNALPRNPMLDGKRINAAIYFGYLNCRERKGKITMAQHKSSFQKYLNEIRLPVKFINNDNWIDAMYYVDGTIKNKYRNKCEKALKKIDKDEKFNREVGFLIIQGVPF